MDLHPVISVQQHTPDNDFCHVSISNVHVAFWAFFSKTEKLRSHTGSKIKMMTRWPGDPDVKDDPNDPLIRWPNDPVPCVVCNPLVFALYKLWQTVSLQKLQTTKVLRMFVKNAISGYRWRSSCVSRKTDVTDCFMTTFYWCYRLVMFTYGANLFNRMEVSHLLFTIQIFLEGRLGSLCACQILVWLHQGDMKLPKLSVDCITALWNRGIR